MDTTTSCNSDSNETLEENINLLLENRELTSESEIETKVVSASFSANQELEDNDTAMTLDEKNGQTKINDKSDICVSIIATISRDEA